MRHDLDDEAYAGEVEIESVDEGANEPEPGQVFLGVEPEAAGGTGWMDQPESLVLSQRLWMHRGQPCRDADDVQAGEIDGVAALLRRWPDGSRGA